MKTCKEPGCNKKATLDYCPGHLPRPTPPKGNSALPWMIVLLLLGGFTAFMLLNDRPPPPPPPPLGGDYWITSSGKTHTSHCEYYDNTKEGKFSKEGSGDDCGRCGGESIDPLPPHAKCGDCGEQMWVAISRQKTRYWRCSKNKEHKTKNYPAR